MSRNRRRRKTSDDQGQHETTRAVAGAPRTYTFQWEGKRYTLPPADQSVAKLPAGVVMDAMEGDADTAQLRLGLAYIKAADVDPAAMAALRAMPFLQFSEHVARWMRAAGVRPGESASSST